MLGHGHLGLEPFRCLVNDSRFKGLPMVLETPKRGRYSDEINLEVLRALCGAKRPGTKVRKLMTQSHDAPPENG